MRAVLQRVAEANVVVDDTVVGKVGAGLLAFVGALEGDTSDDALVIARKLATLRIFPDANEKMNLNIRDVNGSILLISQFTLAADTTSGTRPSFSSAMDPDLAKPLLKQLEQNLVDQGIQVETGVFGAKMSVTLVNDGPVTIQLDSRAKKRK